MPKLGKELSSRGLQRQLVQSKGQLSDVINLKVYKHLRNLLPPKSKTGKIIYIYILSLRMYVKNKTFRKEDAEICKKILVNH